MIGWETDRRGLIALAGTGLAATAMPGWARSTVRPRWEELGAKLGDRLIQPVSPLDRCAASGGAGAEALFGKTLKNPFAISDDPGLTQTLSWTGAWQSAPSARVVAARDAQDVAIALDFARTHHVRPIVRGGGHSYFGNSNAAGSLLIWTRPMSQVEQQDAFVPKGAPAGTPPEMPDLADPPGADRRGRHDLRSYGARRRDVAGAGRLGARYLCDAPVQPALG